MIAYFGKPFSYTLYPLSSDQLNIESLPASPVGIYLFDDYPERTDAINGTTLNGSYTILQTVLVWANTNDDLGGKVISLVEVPDPDISAIDSEESYYLAINTTVGVGAQSQLLLRKITFIRLNAQESTLALNIQDLISLEPKVKIYCKCIGDLQSYIDTAIVEVKGLVTGCDFDYGDLLNPKQLSLATAFLALSNFFASEARTTTSAEAALSTRYKERFDLQLKTLKLTSDKSRRGADVGTRGFGLRSLTFVN